MPARELKNLRKELIVGQAYVDAYLLENSVKTIGINLSKDVYDDLQNCGQNVEITEEKIKKETHYVLRQSRTKKEQPKGRKRGIIKR